MTINTRINELSYYLGQRLAEVLDTLSAADANNKLDKAENLSDLTDAAAARDNLGLGDLAQRSLFDDNILFDTNARNSVTDRGNIADFVNAKIASDTVTQTSGTFTGTLGTSTGDLNGLLESRCRYRKSGKLVTVWVHLSYSSAAASSGYSAGAAMRLSGLPFTSAVLGANGLAYVAESQTSEFTPLAIGAIGVGSDYAELSFGPIGFDFRDIPTSEFEFSTCFNYEAD